MKRAVLIGMATAAILAGITITPTVSYASKLTDAQKKAQELAQQKKATQTKITQLKTQEQSLTGQISHIQAVVQNLDSSIIKTQADIVRRNNQIKKLQQEIATTQKQIDSQYAVLQERVRVMVEDGQSGYLDVLFSATSFSDFLDRIQLLAQIAAQDKKVLTDIQTNKKHLDAAKSQVQDQLKQVQQSYSFLLKQKSQEENQQRSEQALLAKVHDNRLSQQAALKSENSAMQNLQSLIKQLEAEEGAYTGASDGWTWPVPGHYTISSPYGWRTWSDGSKEFHNGIDIAAPMGTPMVAATGGKVLYAGPASGFGDWIVIQSAGGLLEIYGHMYAYEIKVHPGEIVHRGQRIAAVGSNGFSTGPHLHFTVATGFNSAGFPISVNPTKYVGK